MRGKKTLIQKIIQNYSVSEDERIQILLHSLIPLFGGVIHLSLLIFLQSKFQNPKNSNQNRVVSIFIHNFKGDHFLKSNFKILDQNALSLEQMRLSSDEKDMIRLINVNKKYPKGHKALHNLNFGVEKGQIFCLLGPNGAGKTTTFDILTKKISFDSGQIEFQGQDFADSKMLPTIGLCPQSNILWDFMTVEEHLKVYSYIKGISNIDENILFQMKSLGLETHSHKKVSQLSGGTKRKLCVALAVLGAPDIILLDEPTTGVDPIGRNQIWNLLKTICKEKPVTILLSTHYIEDAELVADKLGK